MNGCRQNESTNSWLKHHKQIHQDILTSEHHFQLKCKSIIHTKYNQSPSPVVSHIKIQPHICLEPFWTVLVCKRCLICAHFSPDSDQNTFSLEELQYYGLVMFLSAVWTLILTAPIHCRASIAEQVMKCYISPNQLPWINKFINCTSWMSWG